MFKHILVPTDGSQLSQDTSRRAVTFAKETGARVTAFYAKPEYPVTYYGEGALIDSTTPEQFAELAEQQAQEILGFVERLCQDAGVSCTKSTLTSDIPYEAIIDAATQGGAGSVACYSAAKPTRFSRTPKFRCWSTAEFQAPGGASHPTGCPVAFEQLWILE